MVTWVASTFLAIVNNAGMNMVVQITVLLTAFKYLSLCPEVELTDRMLTA